MFLLYYSDLIHYSTLLRTRSPYTGDGCHKVWLVPPQILYHLMIRAIEKGNIVEDDKDRGYQGTLLISVTNI